ncbi:GlcG/HbpS family heme-binding protein [Trebonia sp.]|uniref:GlcG/HbpS family heme-binding protein n=1 Tax=Trebonia sp. TaxID=2767075 RepID=UPI003BB0C536
MTLPFADARILADGARALALETGKALSLAVVDYGGFIVLVERMDGARPMTPSIALSKAYSAAVMQRPTSMLENWRNSDPVFFTQVGRMGQHPWAASGSPAAARTRTRRSARTCCGRPGSTWTSPSGPGPGPGGRTEFTVSRRRLRWLTLNAYYWGNES